MGWKCQRWRLEQEVDAAYTIESDISYNGDHSSDLGECASDPQLNRYLASTG